MYKENNKGPRTVPWGFVCLCWGLTSQSTIFQSCRDGATASWVINQYFRGVKCLAQGHKTAAVGFEPRPLAPESDTLPLSHRAPLGALGDTWQNRSPVRFYSIYNNSLLSEAKKRIYPFQCLATDSIAKQFAFKEFMRGCIKIQYECVNLSSIVQDFSPIIYYRSQLSFTTMAFPECMLPIWQEFMFIKMSHDIWTYYVFE